MTMTNSNDLQPTPNRWYSGITKYQWLVLTIASLGWIFDVFEGQIFVASMNEAMPSLLPPGATGGDQSFYNSMSLASFLLGGAIGGVLFGALSDIVGRTRTMIVTILMYSVFTSITAFAQTPEQMIALRFLVAMGVGGEWAVASAMVAEVFPSRARAWSGSIFHASSVFGTLLAVVAGVWIVGNPQLGWRWGFAIGAAPALLILWIRWSLKEPEAWTANKAARASRKENVWERWSQLFDPDYLRLTVLGVALAAVGLSTFWGVHIYGKDAMRAAKQRAVDVSEAPADTENVEQVAARTRQLKNFEMLGMALNTIGGGLGLLMFGPISDWLGRRGAFALFHVGGLVMGLLMFWGLHEPTPLVIGLCLPVFGFLTLGMHAGYAIYFPELFPTHLRGSGTGFCFNVGRVIAASVQILSGWLQKERDFSMNEAATVLSFLFILGLFLLPFAPETKGRELPR